MEFVWLSSDMDLSRSMKSSQGDVSRSSDAVQAALRPSNTKAVGTRCYAKYSNGQYFWGSIRGLGPQQTFCVEFEDGDVLPNVDETSLYTEKEYVRTVLLYTSV